MFGLDPFELTGNILLFLLVFGMSATVDVKSLLAQIRNHNAILTGLFLQFMVLPFLGFCVVKLFNLSHPTGITLLVVTSSPGGSYSNWWCSIFNADLALSVTMTAISTIVSVIMLPMNLLLYAKYTFEEDVIDSLDWEALFAALIIVIVAIGSGLLLSGYFKSRLFNKRANKIGNIAGVLLVIFSCIMSNADKEARLWNRSAEFYFSVSLPCCLGLLAANCLTTFLRLEKPERVTVSIECCYQNIGIATSVALTMFDNNDQAEAMGVPVFYGAVEGIILLIYCLTAWKFDWTKAPKHAPFWKVIVESYEVIKLELEDLKEIEVSIGDLSSVPETISREGSRIMISYVEMPMPGDDIKQKFDALEIEKEGEMTQSDEKKRKMMIERSSDSLGFDHV